MSCETWSMMLAHDICYKPEPDPVEVAQMIMDVFGAKLKAARAMKEAIDGALYGTVPWDELRPVLKAASKQAEEAGI